MTLIEQVVAILTSNFVQNLKPFSFGGVSYVPASNLETVSVLINLGLIHVETKPGLAGARYRMGKDLIQLPPSFTSPIGQMLIVHEAIHAWQDTLLLGQMPAENTEGAAYIVGMMFLVQQVDAGKRWKGSTPDRDWVAEAAWNLAEQIMQGKTPSASDYKELSNAVSFVPEYQGTQDYDGVGNPLLFYTPWWF